MFTSGSTADETIGCWRGEPLYHASLEPAEVEACLKGAGLQIESFEQGVWLARRAILSAK